MTPLRARLPASDLPTRSQAVAEQLRRGILSGEIEPGTRLRQNDLAQQYGVSTTPVREAFLMLEREGLAVSDAHRGVIVFRPTLEDLQENYELRIVLESLGADKAAVNATDQDLVEITALFDEMHGLEDALRYMEVNTAFHERIYAAARRRRLAAMIKDLRNAGYAYGQLFAARMPGPEQTEAEHRDILEALQASAPRKAAQAMTRHLRNNADFVARQIAKARG